MSLNKRSPKTKFVPVIVGIHKKKGTSLGLIALLNFFGARLLL